MPMARVGGAIGRVKMAFPRHRHDVSPPAAIASASCPLALPLILPLALPLFVGLPTCTSIAPTGHNDHTEFDVWLFRPAECMAPASPDMVFPEFANLRSARIKSLLVRD